MKIMLLFLTKVRQMYHHIGAKTTVSLKIRQSVGVCIIMNNKEKNTLKIDIDELRTKAIFKIDFIDNLNSL